MPCAPHPPPPLCEEEGIKMQVLRVTYSCFVFFSLPGDAVFWDLTQKGGIDYVKIPWF